MFSRIGSTGSPPSSPHFADTDRSPSPQRNPEAAGPSRAIPPATPLGPSTVRRNFLERTLGNKDLADLADMVDRSGHPWALTGSTAIKMWGHELNHEEAKKVVPNDADIVSTEAGVDSLSRIKIPTGIEGEPPKERGTTFNFTNTLPVDLIASSARKPGFGKIPEDVRNIYDTPVMSLDALLKSKKTAARFAGEFGNAAKVRRSMAHIQLIEALIPIDAQRRTTSPGKRSPTAQIRPAGAASAQGSAILSAWSPAARGAGSRDTSSPSSSPTRTGSEYLSSIPEGVEPQSPAQPQDQPQPQAQAQAQAQARAQPQQARAVRRLQFTD